MVMYCTTDNLVGGGTNFGHSGVFVKPKVGVACWLLDNTVYSFTVSCSPVKSHSAFTVTPLISQVGAAAFFSYLDAETRLHETGYTTHSGCPVVEGVKRIAVHWMRIGVSKEMPWDSFNTLNIHKSECADDGA